MIEGALRCIEDDGEALTPRSFFPTAFHRSYRCIQRSIERGGYLCRLCGREEAAGNRIDLSEPTGSKVSEHGI
jgi:hypothetical protein